LISRSSSSNNIVPALDTSTNPLEIISAPNLPCALLPSPSSFQAASCYTSPQAPKALPYTLAYRHGGSSSSSRASPPCSHHRPSSQDLLLLASSYGRASRPTSARVVVSSPAAAGSTGCRHQPHDLQGELPTARRQAMAVQEGRPAGRRGGRDYKLPGPRRGGAGEQTTTAGGQQQHAGGRAAGHRPRVVELVSQLHRRRLLPVGVYLLQVEEENMQGPTARAQTRGQMGWPRASCAASMAARASCFCSPVRPSGSVTPRHPPEAWTSAWLSSAASTRRSCTLRCAGCLRPLAGPHERQAEGDINGCSPPLP